jgi:hypothetical protein
MMEHDVAKSGEVLRDCPADIGDLIGYLSDIGTVTFAPTGRTLKRPSKERALLFFGRVSQAQEIAPDSKLQALTMNAQGHSSHSEAAAGRS